MVRDNSWFLILVLSFHSNELSNNLVCRRTLPEGKRLGPTPTMPLPCMRFLLRLLILPHIFLLLKDTAAERGGELIPKKRRRLVAKGFLRALRPRAECINWWLSWLSKKKGKNAFGRSKFVILTFRLPLKVWFVFCSFQTITCNIIKKNEILIFL